MSATNTAIHSFLKWITGTTNADTAFNDLVDKLDRRLGLSVKSMTTDAEPGSPAEGDCYIITGSATGTDWATFTQHHVAAYRDSAWVAEAPNTGQVVHVQDESNAIKVWSGAAWIEITQSTLHKYDATTAPVAGDDSGDGYSVGSIWVDVTNDKAYICLDATAATAVWTEITQSGGSSGFEFSSDVETVADQDYVLWWDAPFAGSITKVRTKTQSGTCTVTGKINTTALGGTVNSASTTAQEQTHSSSNTFSIGDKILFTVSANSTAIDLSVIFYGTRT